MFPDSFDQWYQTDETSALDPTETRKSMRHYQPKFYFINFIIHTSCYVPTPFSVNERTVIIHRLSIVEMSKTKHHTMNNR